jgi:hypothetical protein
MRYLGYVFVFAVFLSSCSHTSDEIKLFTYISGEKVGYFNKEGKIVINPQFSKGGWFTEGKAAVANAEGKCGFINEEGRYIINPQYKEVSSFSEGLAAVIGSDGQCRYIDEKGNVKFTLPFAEQVGVFSEGLAVYYEGGKAGYIDQSGNIAINAQFDNARPFSEGLGVVRIDDEGKSKYGYIDKKGKWAINAQFDDAVIFSEGLASVQSGDKWGFINKEGKFDIQPQFSEFGMFFNGMAAMVQDDKYGFIDKKGKFVIDPQYSGAYGFAANGLALVATGEAETFQMGFIDKSGEYAINPQFGFANAFCGDIAIAGTGEDNVGIIDSKGKYIVNPQFKIPFVIPHPATSFLNMKHRMIESDQGLVRKTAKAWLKGFYRMDYENLGKISTDTTIYLLSTLIELSIFMPDSTKEAMRNTAITIRDVQVQGDHASVVYFATIEKKPQTLKLVRLDDKWRVHFSRKDPDSETTEEAGE